VTKTVHSSIVPGLSLAYDSSTVLSHSAVPRESQTDQTTQQMNPTTDSVQTNTQNASNKTTTVGHYSCRLNVMYLHAHVTQYEYIHNMER